MKRLELGDRYWAFEVRGDLVDFVWGKTGDMTQTHSRRLASPEAAAAYAELQVAKQRELGFVEVAPPPPPEATAPAPQPAGTEARDPEAPVARSIRFEIAAETSTSYRRYPQPARFLELEQRDRLVVTWSGELHPEDGGKPPRREVSYDTIAEASEVYDEEVLAVREDNWTQVSSSRIAVFERELALEAQCRAAADDDPAPWSVYADWLLERGDPLGEIATTPSHAAAKRRFDAELEELGLDHRLVAIERRHGFPRVARLVQTSVDEAHPTRLAFAARAVRSCSPGRFIDVLRFGLGGYSSDNDWAPTLRALAEAPHPEQLKELYFTEWTRDDCEISWASLGDLTGLFAPFTSLEVLHLRSGGGTLGPLALPALRTFIRESGGLAAAEVAAITSAQWPRLEHLEIWFGSANYGAQSNVASIRSLLDGEGPPVLRHLGIVNCEWVEDAIDALAHSKLLPALSSLDLSKGILARRGVALLREHARAFRHLASIDLSDNLMSDDEAAQLREVLDNVIVTPQREREDDEDDEDDHRYVAVGE